MSIESRDVFTQFVIGPVQTTRRRHKWLFFPYLEQIGGTSRTLIRFYKLVKEGADFEALQEDFGSAPVPDLLDADEFANIVPMLAAALDALDDGNWAGAIEQLKAADADAAALTGSLNAVHAAILANLVGAANTPAAELGLRLLKAMWIAGMVAEPRRLARAGFDGPVEDYVSQCWTSGGPILDCRLPRSREAPWPATPPEPDPPHGGGKAPEDAGARIGRLEGALRELGQAEGEQAIIEAAAAPPPVSAPSEPPRIPGFLERLFGLGPRTPALPAAPAPAIAPASRRLDPKLRRRLSAATAKTLAEEGIALDEVGIGQALQTLRVRTTGAYDGAVWEPPYNYAVNVGGAVIEIDQEVFAQAICRPAVLPCHCDLLAELDEKHGGASWVRVLGTGRAYRIDQTLLPYEKGELVHTEPVLGGSDKKTSFRKLDRLEESEETETERETFEESEATTHDQFSLSNEISKTSEQQRQTDMGASLTASYGGTVSVSANFDTSSTSGTQQSENAAVSNAREVINKALKRVRERMETRRTMKRMSETERRDSFRVKADGGSFTGFYRAIDKAYSNQLVCVGERLVIRVSMQHPMAYLLHCMATGRAEGVTLPVPVAPADYKGTLGKLVSFNDITPTNYAAWAALYEVEGLKPPPGPLRVSAEVAVDYQKEMKDTMAGSMSIDVPVGYECFGSVVTAVFSEGSGRYIHGHVGDGYYLFSLCGWKMCQVSPSIELKVPVTYRGYVSEYALTIVLWCGPTAEAIEKWKISVYDAIMKSYRRKQEAYEAQVQAALISGGIAIEGENPLKNRLMIEQELQKFVLGAVYPPLYYRGFDSLKWGAPCVNGVPDPSRIVPEPDFADAHGECPWLTFFTQLFEWKNMVYQFQPYYYGQRQGWATLRRLRNDDAFLENALAAGQVLIDIPVAPHMTEPFLFFLQTGRTWMGGEMPIFGDPHFVDIATAIRLAETIGDGAVCENVKPWVTKVPTSLVYVTDTPPDNLL